MREPKAIKYEVVSLWVNIVLVGVASLLLFYYVMMANSVASANYKVQTLNDKINTLSEANGLLMSKKLAMEIPAVLSEFAKAQNLVEAKNVAYIFENKNVAQR